MKEIIAHVTTEEAANLSQIHCFIPCYMCNKPHSLDPCEWGYIEFAGLKIIFFADVIEKISKTYSIRKSP